MHKLVWRLLPLVLVLVLTLVVVVFSFSQKQDNRSRAADSGPALSVGSYIQSDHGKYQGGLKSQGANSSVIIGSHNRFAWSHLEPSPGQYNWGEIDSWLGKIQAANKKAVLSIMLRCEDNAGGDICAPGWVVGSDYQPILVDATKVPASCGFTATDPRLKRLNYLNTGVKEKIAALVAAFGARYKDNPTISHIELDVGYWGEANPGPVSNVACDKAAQTEAYKAAYSSEQWVGYANWLVDQYAAAFENKKPISVLTNGLLHSHEERQGRVTHILDKIRSGYRLGFHNTGLEPDFPIGAKVDGIAAQDLPAGDPRAYRAQWTPLERHWQEAFVSFEGQSMGARTNYHLPAPPNDAAFMWWSILNALDKHASVVYFYSNNINSKNDTWDTGSPAWEWRNKDALEFFNQFAGRTAQTTPEAWIAFRTSMIKAPQTEGNPEFYFGDVGDYEFFIKHKLDASSESQIGHYAAERFHGGANLPWDNNENDWRGAYNRQTDSANDKPYLSLDIDDGFLRQPTQPVDVIVTYYDGIAAMAGNSWKLEYDSANGPGQTAEVSLQGSNTWKEKTFTLTGATFNNGLSGADLRLKATKGDTYFHMVRVKRGSNNSCSKNYDLTGDGKINLRDYSAWSLALNQTGDNLPADFNCDKSVNLLDYELLRDQLKVE